MLLGAILLAALFGCADVRVPEYRGVDTPAKASWAGPPASVSPAKTIDPDWWKEFGDAYLNRLVADAIAGNFDLKVLAARIQVSNAQIGEARAGALPTVDVGAGASFEKTTGKSFTKTYNVATQLNWELDVWGKVEKGVQAQTAEFRASEADWRAGYLSLVSNVATTYFQILQFDQQIDQQQRTLRKNGEILGVYQAMNAQGLVPKTEVLRQQAEINQLNLGLVELQRSRQIAENSLATLLGKPAGEFKVPAGRLQDRVQLPEVPAGLPSQLLKRRPDIIAAEYRVLSAYNLEGQANLAQLPSISLTARGGTASFALSDLLKSFTFGFMPSINIPAFDPSIKARVKTSEAQTKVVEAEYQRTVISAFEEVENSLVNLDAHRKQRTELQQKNDRLIVVAAQTEARLKEGLVSQLEVLESERTLLDGQQALLANHQQLLSDAVTLYKALGGGWTAVDVKNAGE